MDPETTASYTIEQLAQIVRGTVRGDGRAVITGVADVAEAQPRQATWLSNPKYTSKLAASRAGVVLVPDDFGETPMPAILCERVDRAVAMLLEAFAPPEARPEAGIHATAEIHPTASIGPHPAIGPYVVIDAGVAVGAACVIHAGVFVGRGSIIGDECVIWPNAVIRDGCRLGNRVVVHPNAVIGADGLGFYFDEGRHNKVPHTGGVIVGDDVEVGACACIDRAKFGNTIVARGTKIDNLVQIAHNVRIGEHCVLAGQVGISGSARLGSYCIAGGQAGVADNVTIGDGARLAGGMTTVAKDIPPGATVSGSPARDHREELRERAWLRRVPALAEQVKELAARIQRLEAATDHPS